MTADVPVVEVVAVDAVLDALDTPTSSEVYSAVEPFSNSAVAAAAAARAIAGGGGGSTPDLAAVLAEGNTAAVGASGDFVDFRGTGSPEDSLFKIGLTSGEQPRLTVTQGNALSVECDEGVDTFNALVIASDEVRINLNPELFTSFVIDDGTSRALRIGFNDPKEVQVGHGTSLVGFYGAAGVAKQTGVAVDAAAIHAALVTLGLITA